MKEILVDTNVLVPFLTDRNADQQEQAARLFQGASERDHAPFIHSMSLVELVYVMTRLYKAEPEKVSKLLGSLLEMPGVETVAEIAWSRILEIWPESFPALGDAILAAAAIESRYDAVATFDLDLRTRLVRQGAASYW